VIEGKLCLFIRINDSIYLGISELEKLLKNQNIEPPTDDMDVETFLIDISEKEGLATKIATMVEKRFIIFDVFDDNNNNNYNIINNNLHY
jgi:hypothetical protein